MNLRKCIESVMARKFKIKTFLTTFYKYLQRNHNISSINVFLHSALQPGLPFTYLSNFERLTKNNNTIFAALEFPRNNGISKHDNISTIMSYRRKT